MTTMAILTDVTRCIGCENCVAACRETNETGTDAPYRWQGHPNDLSSTRWTTLKPAPEGRFARVHCRHCLDPACAAACPVGALKATAEGPVTYDPVICMGCRYCMMACPFRMTRYEWESPTPRVRKCILCYDKIKAGELEQPACTSACPTQATIYGSRDGLLAEARRRIQDNPELYIDHIWGEEEVGGTSVLYISDVDLDTAGWPAKLGTKARPELARKVLHTVPFTFVGVAMACAAVQWTFERRKKVAAVKGQDSTVDNCESGQETDSE
ncbi:MAG: 4Fe-4S dicluster domain-containing protein [bacterium]|nr:4Fe-4S dicluster domain-containing protein [bacterium]